jgi:cytochrome c oxidase subunit 2
MASVVMPRPHIEIGVCIVEAILLIGFAFPLWARQADEFPTGPDVVKLRAVGEQFLWTFHYAGNDGVLGGINPMLTTSTNTIGRDSNDPNGKDDFLSGGVMRIPVGRPCIVDVRSKDVIHNLALVPMRAAQDATPGVKSHMCSSLPKLAPGTLFAVSCVVLATAR